MANKINMFDPDGQPASVDDDQLDQALANGFKVASTIDQAAFNKSSRALKEAEELGAIGAIGRFGLRGLTAGLSDAAFDPEVTAHSRELHPIKSAVAETIGFVGPAFLNKGQGTVAKIAKIAPVNLATKVGAAAQGSVAKLATDSRIVQGIAKLTGTAAEGAAAESFYLGGEAIANWVHKREQLPFDLMARRLLWATGTNVAGETVIRGLVKGVGKTAGFFRDRAVNFRKAQAEASGLAPKEELTGVFRRKDIFPDEVPVEPSAAVPPPDPTIPVDEWDIIATEATTPPAPTGKATTDIMADDVLITPNATVDDFGGIQNIRKRIFEEADRAHKLNEAGGLPDAPVFKKLSVEDPATYNDVANTGVRVPGEPTVNHNSAAMARAETVVDDMGFGDTQVKPGKDVSIFRGNADTSELPPSSFSTAQSTKVGRNDYVPKTPAPGQDNFYPTIDRPPSWMVRTRNSDVLWARVIKDYGEHLDALPDPQKAYAAAVKLLKHRAAKTGIQIQTNNALKAEQANRLIKQALSSKPKVAKAHAKVNKMMDDVAKQTKQKVARETADTAVVKNPMLGKRDAFTGKSRIDPSKITPTVDDTIRIKDLTDEAVIGVEQAPLREVDDIVMEQSRKLFLSASPKHFKTYLQNTGTFLKDLENLGVYISRSDAESILGRELDGPNAIRIGKWEAIKEIVEQRATDRIVGEMNGIGGFIDEFTGDIARAVPRAGVSKISGSLYKMMPGNSFSKKVASLTAYKLLSGPAGKAFYGMLDTTAKLADIFDRIPLKGAIKAAPVIIQRDPLNLMGTGFEDENADMRKKVRRRAAQEILELTKDTASASPMGREAAILAAAAPLDGLGHQAIDGVGMRVLDMENKVAALLPDLPPEHIRAQTDEWLNDSDVEKVATVLRVAEEPFSVLESLIDGTIRPLQVKALQTISPEIFSFLQSEMLINMEKMRNLPAKQRQMATLYFGVPVSSLSTPAALLTTSNLSASLAEEGENQVAGNLAKLKATEQPTIVQRRQG